MNTERMRERVERAQQGDRAAFEAILDELEPHLRSAIIARIGTHLRVTVDADDVYQDTLIRAFESLGRFEWRGDGSFLRWLQGISENVIRSNADKQKRRAVLEVERLYSPPSDVSAGTTVRREERMKRLEKALECLPDDYREVITLARIEGLQIKEIAARMGRSTSAVKNLLLRALKALKENFGDTESFHLPGRPLRRPGDVDAR